jgi:hypothetical protein
MQARSGPSKIFLYFGYNFWMREYTILRDEEVQNLIFSFFSPFATNVFMCMHTFSYWKVISFLKVIEMAHASCDEHIKKTQPAWGKTAPGILLKIEFNLLT